MKTKVISGILTTGLIICLLAFLIPISLDAQRKDTRPSGGKERSSTSKSAASQKKTRSKDVKQPTGGNKPTAQPATGNKTNTQPATRNKATTQPANGNKNNVSTGNNNNVNINNSKNVNINNSHNTVVVANPRPYPRPPYAYGGHSYNAYHPYHYHPYTPYHYGPAYHPWGFFVATIAVTAMIVTVANQQYHYDQGVYYVSSNGGYTVVQAPVGATITTLPPGSQTVVINETTNNYYYGGTYYEKKPEGYTVVPPTAGAVVETLPESGKEVKVGEVNYVKVGETYYQPIVQDGKNKYEVVEVKEEGK